MTGSDATQLQHIRSQSLAGAILQQLEQMILSGRLGPGERINESQLAAAWGVSRAPIREACRQLEKFGVVEVKVNQGTFVRDITIEEALELYDIRAALEALAAEKAAALAQPADIAALERLVAKMATCERTNDTSTYFQLNLQFHDHILAMARNLSLRDMITTVSRKLLLYRKKLLSDPEEVSLSLSQHRAVLAAIEAADAATAGDIMRQHVLKCRDRLKTTREQRG